MVGQTGVGWLVGTGPGFFCPHNLNCHSNIIIDIFAQSHWVAVCKHQHVEPFVFFGIYTYIMYMFNKEMLLGTVVNDLRIRPQMAKFILTKWPHGSSLHTYRVPPGPLDQPWCTPIVSYSNGYTPTPELLGSLLLFWQAIFKLPVLLWYLMYLNVWWCKLTLTYRAK